MSASIKGLDHWAIVTGDEAKCTAFYEGILGLKVGPLQRRRADRSCDFGPRDRPARSITLLLPCKARTPRWKAS